MAKSIPRHRQMRLFDPDGLREVLWVEEKRAGLYTILNVPVFIYGVSVGTVVRGEPGEKGVLAICGLERQAMGGTVRIILPGGELASDWYLNSFLPGASEQHLGVGPATFFDPRMVAVHVHQRVDVWGRVGSYLTELAERRAIQQWVAADPEANQDAAVVERTLQGDGVGALDVNAGILEHPAPTSSREEYCWPDLA